VVAVDEALRNIVCVGANPRHAAILDNFCWPKVESEESLGALVRACRGAHDAAVAFGLPFVSGKDSLNNEFSMSEQEARRVGLPAQIAIPPTLLISSLGIVGDVRRCITMDLKQVGDVLVVASARVDQAGLEKATALHHHVSELIASGKVKAAHDVSDGGLAVAVAEMCIAANFGASVDITDENYREPRHANVPTTYVLEMTEADARAADLPVIGRVEDEPSLHISYNGSSVVDLPVTELATAWRSPLAAGGGG
jgi:phosphoribosylformylglycinamidine synthase